MTPTQQYNLLLAHTPDADEEHLQKYFDIVTKPYTGIGYSEKHHILPRALFPFYEKHAWNLVQLEYQDHVKAHYHLAMAMRIDSTAQGLVAVVEMRAGVVLRPTLDQEFLNTISIDVTPSVFNIVRGRRFAKRMRTNTGTNRAEQARQAELVKELLLKGYTKCNIQDGNNEFGRCFDWKIVKRVFNELTEVNGLVYVSGYDKRKKQSVDKHKQTVKDAVQQKGFVGTKPKDFNEIGITGNMYRANKNDLTPEAMAEVGVTSVEVTLKNSAYHQSKQTAFVEPSYDVSSHDFGKKKYVSHKVIHEGIAA